MQPSEQVGEITSAALVMMKSTMVFLSTGSRYARFSGKGVVLGEPRLRANGLHGRDISDWTLEAWARFDFSDQGPPAPPQGVVSFQSTQVSFFRNRVMDSGTQTWPNLSLLQDRTYFGIALSAGPDRYRL